MIFAKHLRSWQDRTGRASRVFAPFGLHTAHGLGDGSGIQNTMEGLRCAMLH